MEGQWEWFQIGQQYSGFMSSNWAWDQAVSSSFFVLFIWLTSALEHHLTRPETLGAMFIPVILGSDKTTVSVTTGQNEHYPLCASIGNAQNHVQRAHRNAEMHYRWLDSWLFLKVCMLDFLLYQLLTIIFIRQLTSCFMMMWNFASSAKNCFTRPWPKSCCPSSPGWLNYGLRFVLVDTFGRWSMAWTLHHWLPRTSITCLCCFRVVRKVSVLFLLVLEY